MPSPRFAQWDISNRARRSARRRRQHLLAPARTAKERADLNDTVVDEPAVRLLEDIPAVSGITVQSDAYSPADLSYSGD